MELRPGYREWTPPDALTPAVSCLWTSVAQDSGPTLVLPDGCTDLIWSPGVGTMVAGPDTGPAPSGSPRPGMLLVGLRLRPGAGGAVLGLPLSELRDQRVDLADVLPAAARRLPGDLSAGVALGRLTALVTERLADGAPDGLAVAAAGRLAATRCAAPSRTGELAAGLGVSERQLRRRCLDAVGYGPKTLHRILRFRRFVSLVDDRGTPLDLASAAATAGYADQAHLSRETVRLAGLTPTALIRERRG